MYRKNQPDPIQRITWEKSKYIYITLTEMSKYGAKVQIMYTVGDDTHLTL